MLKKINAGIDFLMGSLILKCISTEPINKAANPRAAGFKNVGNQMAAIKPSARVTFKKPIR